MSQVLKYILPPLPSPPLPSLRAPIHRTDPLNGALTFIPGIRFLSQASFRPPAGGLGSMAEHLNTRISAATAGPAAADLSGPDDRTATAAGRRGRGRCGVGRGAGGGDAVAANSDWR